MRSHAQQLDATERLITSTNHLTRALRALAEQQKELTAVHQQQVAQQTATNLIVLAQTSADPELREHLLNRAAASMGLPRLTVRPRTSTGRRARSPKD